MFSKKEVSLTMEQTPSIGRTVHYRALGSADGKFPVGECRAAIITAWPDPEHVSLCILNPTGMYFNQSVEYSAEEKPGTWHWPERK